MDGVQFFLGERHDLRWRCVEEAWRRAKLGVSHKLVCSDSAQWHTRVSLVLVRFVTIRARRRVFATLASTALFDKSG